MNNNKYKSTLVAFNSNPNAITFRVNVSDKSIIYLISPPMIQFAYDSLKSDYKLHLMKQQHKISCSIANDIINNLIKG